MAQDETAVRLWTVDVQSIDADRLFPLLNGAERARATALSSSAVRQRFVCTRATLRAALAELTGAEPAALILAEGPHGKPRLGGGAAIGFNVSHSGRLALVAVAPGREVGVDVERVRARARLEQIAERCFSAAERTALAHSAGGDRLGLFYAVWTAREAYVKATGRGLAATAESFEIPSWPQGGERPVPVAERGMPQPRFSLRRLAPADGYAGALVAEGQGWEVEHRPPPAAVRAA